MTPDTGRRRARGLEAGISGWQRVSVRYLGVEYASIAISAVVGLLVAAGLWLVLQWLGLAIGAAVLVVAVVSAVLAPRRVGAIGYVLREDDLVFRRGILLSRVVAVPYGRMQLVDINRGPVARLLGLAELRLVTAAASTGVTIPGLAEQDAAALRDRLVERAEERRVGL